MTIPLYQSKYSQLPHRVQWLVDMLFLFGLAYILSFDEMIQGNVAKSKTTQACGMVNERHRLMVISWIVFPWLDRIICCR